jgi:hypothetical protein
MTEPAIHLGNFSIAASESVHGCTSKGEQDQSPEDQEFVKKELTKRVKMKRAHHSTPSDLNAEVRRLSVDAIS